MSVARDSAWRLALIKYLQNLQLYRFRYWIGFYLIKLSWFMVKRVSWFKSSLLLRINNKHTYKYSFLIKTILIEKYIQQRRRTSWVQLGLGLMETGSILIRESVNALQNVRQGVSKCFGAQALEFEKVKENSYKYIDNEVYSLSHRFYNQEFNCKTSIRHKNWNTETFSNTYWFFLTNW